MSNIFLHNFKNYFLNFIFYLCEWFFLFVAVHITLRLAFIVHLYLIIFIRPLASDIIDEKKKKKTYSISSLYLLDFFFSSYHDSTFLPFKTSPRARAPVSFLSSYT